MSATKTAAAALYARLTAAVAPEGLTGSDVLARRPTREDVPCVVYVSAERDSARVLAQAPPTALEIGFDVDIWHTTYTGLRDVQVAIEDALEGLNGEVSTAVGTLFVHDLLIDSAGDRPLFPLPGEPDGLYRAQLSLTLTVNNS